MLKADVPYRRPSRRLTSPSFSPAAAQRIADAAALQGRTVGNLIAHAALLYADQVLKPSQLPSVVDEVA